MYCPFLTLLTISSQHPQKYTSACKNRIARYDIFPTDSCVIAEGLNRTKRPALAVYQFTGQFGLVNTSPWAVTIYHPLRLPPP